jgi:hypothetical protein
MSDKELVERVWAAMNAGRYVPLPENEKATVERIVAAIGDSKK